MVAFLYIGGNLPSSVFCQGSIIVVDNTGLRVEDDIFQDRAKFDCIEDIWFLLAGESNALSVALQS